MRRIGWVGLFLAGCPGKGDGETIAFEDRNNYAFDGTFTIDSVQVGTGANFCIDWSAVTTDIRDRAFDPVDVDQVALLQFDLTPSEVADQIDTNQLRQDDASNQYLWSQPGGESSACTQDFEIIGNAFDPAVLVEDDAKTWIVSLIDLDTGKNDILMTLFVEPAEASENDAVAVTDASAELDYTVDIAGKPGLAATADAGAWTLDWSAVTNDVNGTPFDPLLGDELLIAHYSGFASVNEVEGVFLQLDTVADETFTMDVYGEVDADLSGAEDAGGQGFGGFTTDGVWLVAVSCTTCTSPVPMLLGWVDVK